MTATSTPTAALASHPAPATRGFAPLPCLDCGKTECVYIRLHDLTTFVCEECGAELTLDEVRERLDPWARVIAWVKEAPTID